MGLAGGDVGDERALVIRPFAHMNAQLLAQAGTPAIGQHRQVAIEGGFIIEGQAIAILKRLHVDNFSRATPADHVRVQTFPQALTQPGVFNHITQRRNTFFAGRQPRR